VAAALTSNEVDDAAQIGLLLDQVIDPMAPVTLDAAVIVPPRRTANDWMGEEINRQMRQHWEERERQRIEKKRPRNRRFYQWRTASRFRSAHPPISIAV
jgi:hypothetical protein